MDWKYACSKSKLHKAIRKNKWHTYIKKEDGTTFYINKFTKIKSEIKSEKLKGYTDWEPYNG